MVSLLGEQLGTVRQAVHARRPVISKGKVSLLFSPREAAEVDLQSIYGLAAKGFQELCDVDVRLQAYRATLYSPASVDVDRQFQTQEQNHKLDASIDGVLSLMADHFLLPAATQALEFLVRRFSVEQHNQEALMRAFLVYHETTQFVRLVQIMPLADTKWSWLQPMQRSGMAMPRHTLTQRCIKDQAILRFVADTARASAATEACAQLQTSFYVALSCDVIVSVPRVDEALAGALLPNVREGLGRGASKDMRAAAYCVLACLAKHTTLSMQLLSEATERLVKTALPEDSQLTLILLALLCKTQPQMKKFTAKTLKHLVKHQHLVADLAANQRDGASIGALMAVLLPDLASAYSFEQMPNDKLEHLIVGILEKVQLDPDVVQAIASELLTAVVKEPDSASERAQSLARILRVIARKDAKGLDAALQDVLATTGTAAQQQAKLGPLLWAGLSGAAFAPLPDGNTTLALAVDAGSPETRIMALRELDKRAAEEADAADFERSDANVFLTQALLRRLKDDSMEVAALAASLRSLGRLPPAALFDALEALMHRATAILARPARSVGLTKSDRKHARALTRQVLKAVRNHASAFVSAALRDRAAALVLEALLLCTVDAEKSLPDDRVVAAALRAAEALQHPLLQGLSSLQMAEATKDDGEGQAVSRMRSVAVALSQRLADDNSAQAAAAGLLTDSRPAVQILLALATIHACSVNLSGSKETISAAVLPALLTALASSDACAPTTAPALTDAADNHLPTAAFLDLTKSDQQAACVAVLRTALLHGLEARPLTTREWLQVDIRAFQTLANLQPAAAYQEHLNVLLSKIAAVVSPPKFLAMVFGGIPLHACSEAFTLQVRALQLLQSHLSAVVEEQPSQQAEYAAEVVQLLPHIMAALSSEAADVRTAAVELALSDSPLIKIASHVPPDGNLASTHFVVLVEAIARVAADVRRDGEAFLAQLADTFAAAEQPAEKVPAIPSGRGKNRRKTVDVATTVGPLALPVKSATAIADFLTSKLSELHAAHDSTAARTVLKALAQWHTPGARLLAALPLLRQIAPQANANADAVADLGVDVLAVGSAASNLDPGKTHALEPSAMLPPDTAAGESLQPALAHGLNKVLVSESKVRHVAAMQTGPGAERQALTCDLLRLYTAEAVRQAQEAMSAGKFSGDSKALMDPFVSVGWGLDQGWPGTPAERVVARKMMSPELHAVLSPHDQRRTFLGLMWGSMADTDTQARQAALDALRQLPLQLRYVQQLLDGLAAFDQKPNAPTTAKKRARASSNAADVATIPGVQVLEAAVAAMEMLESRPVEGDASALIATLCRCLRALAAACTTAAAGAVATQQAADGDADSEGDGNEQGASGATQTIIASLPGAGQLSYAMRVCLSVLGNLAATGDTMGQNTAVEEASWDVPAILTAARAAVDGDAQRQALKLLSTLARWKPDVCLGHVLEVVGLAGNAATAPMATETSFQAANEALLAVMPAWLAAGRPASKPAEAIVAVALDIPHHRQLPLLKALYNALPKEDALHVVLLELIRASQQAAAERSKDISTDTAFDDAMMSGQGLDLAASICSQATEAERAWAFVSLIRAAGGDNSPGKDNLQLHLTLLITAQQMARLSSYPSQQPESDELHEAYAALHHLALRQLVGTKGGIHDAARLVVASLRDVMSPASYASAIVALAADKTASERLRRKALKLLAVDAAAIAETVEEPSGSTRDTALAAVEAALSFCPHVQEFFADANGQPALAAATRQAALSTFGSLARSLGPLRPGPLARAAPAVLAAVSDANRAVRSSALIAIGISLQAVPLLPQAAPVLLTAASSAITSVATAEAAEATAHAATPRKAATGKAAKAKAQRQEGSGSMQSSAALEAATALSAIAALVRALPKFLSPYLPAIIQLCLNPKVWSPSCAASGAAVSAQGIRQLLPSLVPARLLLPALVGQWSNAQAAGAASIRELLVMVAASISSNTPATIATHAEAAFRFILPALDVRQTERGKLTELEIFSVESAAVKVFEELTLKLNERIFKPLFLRFVEWARAPLVSPAAGNSAAEELPQSSARPAMLFMAAAALTRRMQTVFVPYFRYLMEPLVAAFETGSSPEAPSRPAKRRRSASHASSNAAASGSPGHETAIWYTRLQALTALEQCFLREGGSFLDKARFRGLLTPLVAQLSAGSHPDAATTSALAAALPQDLVSEAHTWEPSADSGLLPEQDPYGIAVVAALVRLATGSDIRHRPLNRAVLMATRGADLRTRQRALAVTHGIVGALREEYALLLPESLPFMSELLEDEDAGVAASAASLVTRLEELTGEGLDQHLKI